VLGGQGQATPLADGTWGLDTSDFKTRAQLLCCLLLPTKLKPPSLPLRVSLGLCAFEEARVTVGPKWDPMSSTGTLLGTLMLGPAPSWLGHPVLWLSLDTSVHAPCRTAMGLWASCTA
jgi:hypothetical protein